MLFYKYYSRFIMIAHFLYNFSIFNKKQSIILHKIFSSRSYWINFIPYICISSYDFLLIPLYLVGVNLHKANAFLFDCEDYISLYLTLLYNLNFVYKNIDLLMEDRFLVDIIAQDPIFKSLEKYFTSISLNDIKLMTVEDLRSTYSEDPSVDDIGEYDRLLDSFIKKYLVDYLPKPKRCEEDHCCWDYVNTEVDPQCKNAKYYTCLRWVCEEDYKSHQEKFICSDCLIEQCCCQIGAGCDEKILCYDCRDNKY